MKSAEKTRLALAIRLYCSIGEIEQKSLAKAWGCSESTVTRFMAGQAMPTAQTMLRMFQWLLEEEPQEPNGSRNWRRRTDDARQRIKKNP